MTMFEDLFGTVDEKTFDVQLPDASSGDGVIRTDKQCEEWAEKLDCNLIKASDKELFIDIDTEDQFKRFCLVMPCLARHVVIERIRIVPSKQGLPHRHITVDLKARHSEIQRIAMQACLGSDSLREALSIVRNIRLEDNVVLFFEPKSSEKEIVLDCTIAGWRRKLANLVQKEER